MSFVCKPDEQSIVRHPGANSYPLHSFRDCQTMLNVFYETEYPAQFGIHEDHEGFFVLSGEGKFLLSGEEFDIEPGTAMIAPSGAPHGLKKRGEADLVVFIFHFPVTKGGLT